MNKITVNFEVCSPLPSKGYKVLWRVAGSGVAYTNAGNFFISPAVFYDNAGEPGTEYEGIIRSMCNSGNGTDVTWSTTGGGGSGGESGQTGNFVYGSYANDQGLLCSQLLEGLWLDPLHFVIQPGAIVYLDEALTMPLTGYDYIIDNTGEIFFINSFNSHVGSPTGFSC